MSAGNYNIIVQQGATFYKQILIKADGAPFDLTGYTARAQARLSVSNPDILFSFTCSIPTPINGVIILSLTAEQTRLLNFTKGVYDIEIVKGIVVDRIMQGSVILSKEVTR